MPERKGKIMGRKFVSFYHESKFEKGKKTENPFHMPLLYFKYFEIIFNAFTNTVLTPQDIIKIFIIRKWNYPILICSPDIISIMGVAYGTGYVTQNQINCTRRSKFGTRYILWAALTKTHLTIKYPHPQNVRLSSNVTVRTKRDQKWTSMDFEYQSTFKHFIFPDLQFSIALLNCPTNISVYLPSSLLLFLISNLLVLPLSVETSYLI